MSANNTIKETPEEIPQPTPDHIENQKPILPTHLKSLEGFIQVVSAVPTYIPKNFYDSIKICNGVLYIFNYSTNAWVSFEAGNMIQSSGTTLPDASTNSGKFYYLTTTDTLYRSNGTAWIALN
jgi:hypothetical protein